MEFESYVSLSLKVMEFESESYGVCVQELWSLIPRFMDFEYESY